MGFWSCGLRPSRGAKQVVNAPLTEQIERSLSGRRIALAGKLASMSRRDADKLIRDHGGILVAAIDTDTDLVVVSDDTADLARFAAESESLDEAARAAWRQGDLEVVHESELWARLG